MLSPEPWILDTHIWIRLLNGDTEFQRSAFLSDFAERSKGGHLRLADISLWETSMLVAKGRLRLAFPVKDWLVRGLEMRGLEVVPVNPAIAADSCFLPGAFHGDPADRLIVATARHLAGTLVTLDQAILDYASKGWLRVLNPATV